MLTIHIGYPKTGTTSIQGFLSANAEALLRARHVYSPIGLLRNLSHSNLAYELTGDERFDPARGSWADLAETIRREPDTNYIISAELLYRASSEKCTGLARLLDGVETRVIVYLRHQAELIQGFFTQAVRAKHRKAVGAKHEFLSFDRFFRLQLRDEDERYAYYDYLVKWQDVGALTVRVFEKGSLVGGDVVTDFLEAAGVTIDRSALAAEPARLNESKGKKTMAMLQEVQSRLRPRERGLKYTAAALQALVTACSARGWDEEKCVLLSDEQIDRCEMKFRRQNQLVATRLLGSPDGILFRHRPESGAPLSDALESLSHKEWIEFTAELVRRFARLELDAAEDE